MAIVSKYQTLFEFNMNGMDSLRRRSLAGLQTLFVCVMCFWYVAMAADRDNVRDSAHHRPCLTLSGKSIVSCGFGASSLSANINNVNNNQLATGTPSITSSSASDSDSASVSDSTSGSDPISLSSSGYVANAQYRFTSNEVANRKYAQLKLQNQRLIQRLQHPPTNQTINPNAPVESLEIDEHNALQTAFTSLSSPNATHKHTDRRIFEDIYGIQEQVEGKDKDERLRQMNVWLNDEKSLQADSSSQVEVRARPPFVAHNGRGSGNKSRKHLDLDPNVSESKAQEEYADYDENQDNVVGEGNAAAANSGNSGTSKTPPCATSGRFYCSYKEDYPSKVVTEVTRYYKWPLEKLFRDLRQQVMPKLANDNYGGLVCDSITRVIRPGWARNTANRWLVVINTEMYQQYITEVVCRHGADSQCNFIPPCYHATCKQRFNTQKLLVIDPWNPYKGPFLSEFLFASCCVCYIPEQPFVINSNQAPAASASESAAKFMDPPPSSASTSGVKNEF